MKQHTIQAAITLALLTSSAVHAQQAVQWKVADGGNGHWYQVLVVPGGIRWTSARAQANSRGGDLATPKSVAEDDFCWGLVQANESLWNGVPAECGHCASIGGPWLGGFQDHDASTYSEPAAGWSWVDGTAMDMSDTRWFEGGPNNAGGGEDYLQYWRRFLPHQWNDNEDITDRSNGFIAEWDADCNADGIVDYGQCHDGTLPDYNGNNIPDCCEHGEACVLGSYPVQWHVEDGGNGHWYQLRTQGLTLAWNSADEIAKNDGGYLASILSEDEDIFVFRLSVTPGAWQGPLGPWLGGAQIPGSGEPVGTWIWLSSGEPWIYAGPNSPFANNGSGVDENRLHYIDHARRWNDIAEDGFPEYFGGIRSLLIEWSADCNNDGIVDYGQILTGQLADANADGIPDICQQPTCVDADLYRDFNVNGADLGIMLSQLGPNTPLTESDLNNDGVVNGADLGLLLSFWGACP
jgi:hypothetical protein